MSAWFRRFKRSRQRPKAPDGTVSTVSTLYDGRRTTLAADGSTSTMQMVPDPRFGMAAPFVGSWTTSTGGLTAVGGGTRSVVLGTPGDFLSLQSMVETSTMNGRTSSSNWDAVSLTLVETSPAGRNVTSTYSGDGKLLTTSVPGLASVERQYDTRGRLSSVTAGSGTETRTTNYTYDGSYLASVTDAMNRSVSYTRDPDGRVLSTQLPDGRLVSATYDANSNLLTLKPPDRPVHSFSYDNRDLTTQYAPPDVTPSGPTNYFHNADMQVITTTRPDGEVTTSDYDSAGRLQTLTIPRGSFDYAYDSMGKLESVTGPSGSTRNCVYQGSLLAGLTSSGLISGSATWTYDNNFRTTQRTVNGANGISFSYDADDLVTGVGPMTIARNAQNGILAGTTLGSVTDSLALSSFAEVLGYTASVGSNHLYAETYVRDKLGRIIQRSETIEGMTTDWGYVYDTAGRLVSVTRDGVAFESYTYDQNDNRSTKTTTVGTTAYGTDSQDRLLSAAEPAGAQSWMYDANGDLVSRNDSGGQTSFDYDTTGQLLSVTKANGDVVSYEFDAGDKRAIKRVSGVVQRKWLYAGGLQPVAEFDANDNLVSAFNGNFIVKNGTIYRLLRDHLGSVRLVVDASTGAVAQKISYGPWGEVLEDTNPGFQPFGFAGGLYDPDTGLVRFGVRDYDPSIGRWTCKDPIGLTAGANLYAYCGNNPTNFVDPTGLDYLDDLITKASNPWNNFKEALSRLFSKQTAVEVADGFGQMADTVEHVTSPGTALAGDALGTMSVGGGTPPELFLLLKGKIQPKDISRATRRLRASALRDLCPDVAIRNLPKGATRTGSIKDAKPFAGAGTRSPLRSKTVEGLQGEFEGADPNGWQHWSGQAEFTDAYGNVDVEELHWFENTMRPGVVIKPTYIDRYNR